MQTLFTLCLLASCAILNAQSSTPLSLSRTIPLTGITGKFDHLAIDTADNRLFISATGNHSVEVIDLKTDKVRQSLTDLGKPHGLVWVAATGSLYVADGSLAELRVYRGTPLALAGKIKLSDDADDMVYDEAQRLLFVGHGGKDAANPANVAIVNTVDFSLVANLPVATHPEALDIDPQSGRVFANIADSNEVAVIGTATKEIAAHWKLTKAADNVPMVFDSEHQLLYVACRTPGMLIFLDATTGKEIASVPTAGGADDLFYDPALRRVYVISGAGEVDSYQVDEAKNLHPLEVLHTAPGAKTALFVPAQNLLYVGVPGVGGKSAEIRVYSTGHMQTPTTDPMKSDVDDHSELKFVVIVSRHGVRSPTGKTDQLNQYSVEPWPKWSVPPGYLTEHGAHLMTLFGAYDREQLAAQGLLAPSGCADASQIRIVADSDQRTRETGKALAEGLAPGCMLEVSALPEGTHDPLFHSLGAGVGHLDNSLAAAAVSGRIGANPQGLTEVYRAQLEVLEEVLRGCKSVANCPGSGTAAPKSIFDIPSSAASKNSGRMAESHSSLDLASTMTENLLLEYTEGMDAANVGWGRVDPHKLRELLQLHTAHEDIADRTSYIARARSSNLLSHILQSLQQAVSTQPVAGAIGKPGDRLLILVGHDTNLATIAGALNLNWLIDGRRDDTPPGGALVFELWKTSGKEEYSVRTYYMAQTLEQMRDAAPLSLQNPPERVPVFVPGCSKDDFSCELDAFQQTLHAATNSMFVK
ncbi:MAG: histidine-type phosphatase [Terracidiphilus sp.]|jgi:4-phytase/acid phosphatase